MPNLSLVYELPILQGMPRTFNNRARGNTMEVGQKVGYKGEIGEITAWAGRRAMLDMGNEIVGWIHQDEFEILAEDEAPEATTIEEAIALLSKDDYSQSGKPKVRAIESILGYDITAAQRDEAWAAIDT